MTALLEAGLVEIDQQGHYSLTPDGACVAVVELLVAGLAFVIGADGEVDAVMQPPLEHTAQLQTSRHRMHVLD